MTASPPTKAAATPAPPAPASPPPATPPAPPAPASPPPATPPADDAKGSGFASDEEASFALVQSVETAVIALQSIRSRLGEKKDATAATGHILDALLTVGGSLRDYDRAKIWALRHAVGGESFVFKNDFDAAATVLAAIVQGLRPTASSEEEARKQTARAEIGAIARLLAQCDNTVESVRAIDQWDRGLVSAKAAADKIAHEARLASAQKPAPPAPAKSASIGKKPAPARGPTPDGDYPLAGSVEAGADPFPTHKVG